MRIAVFGDSFASHQLGPECAYLGKSWIDVIAENNKVVNFGLVASCFQYSYELFLKHSKDFDYNIFLVTEPNRKYIKSISNLFATSTKNRMTQRLGSHDFIDSLIEELVSSDIKDKEIYINTLNSFKIYYNVWRDVEFELHVHDVLVRNILNLKPNTLIVPCFEWSIPSFKPKDTVFTISLLEAISLGLDADSPIFNDYQCVRKCHLSEKNNIILGNKILSAIDNKINFLNLDSEDFVFKLDKPIDYYLKK